MAAVTRTKARFVTPVGYEVVHQAAVVTEAVVAGDPLVLGAGGWSKAPTTATEAHGMAIQDYAAGRGDCSILIQGEMDGFTGMTPGTPLYPSATVAGGIDTTAPTGATIRMRAVTASRIRVNFV